MDFWTLSPESAHQVTYLMGDRGIPKNWREMNGYSSHTYSLVNADGELFWVKFHFHTDQGDGNAYLSQVARGHLKPRNLVLPEQMIVLLRTAPTRLCFSPRLTLFHLSSRLFRQPGAGLA